MVPAHLQSVELFPRTGSPRHTHVQVSGSSASARSAHIFAIGDVVASPHFTMYVALAVPMPRREVDFSSTTPFSPLLLPATNLNEAGAGATGLFTGSRLFMPVNVATTGLSIGCISIFWNGVAITVSWLSASTIIDPGSTRTWTHAPCCHFCLAPPSAIFEASSTLA